MLFKKFLKDLKKSRGMSLVEIMVVLTIIAAVGALVTVNVMRFLDESKVKTTKQQIRNIETALMDFKRQQGFFPSTEQGLEALVNEPTTGKKTKNYPADGYLPKLPKDGWDNPFEYSHPGVSGNRYDIVSLGEDGEEGGEDYATDISNHDTEEEENE